MDYISSNNKVTLTRLAITGRINKDTPLCVLMEICDAHGIKYNIEEKDKPNFLHQMLISIDKTKVPCISSSSTIKELECIARFVNNYSTWKRDQLIKAYNFLIDFMNNDNPLDKVPSDFTYGLQTPENPKKINASILYRICVYNKLSVNTYTSIEQMALAVRMLREDVETIKQCAELFLQKEAKRNDFINIMLMSQHINQEVFKPVGQYEYDHNKTPNNIIGYEMLKDLHKSLVDIKILQLKIDPTTNQGCVALAALNFNIDISKCINPMKEYSVLKISGRNKYIPWDSWMKYWYERNSVMFDLNVVFNPLFPLEYYDREKLNELAKLEGYNESEISHNSAYELLQVAYISETFYMGEMPNLQTQYTIIAADPIEEIPCGQLLCYGQIGESLKPISIGELNEYFEINDNFTSPFAGNSVFTDTNINKLKLLLKSPMGPSRNKALSKETLLMKSQLLQTISNIEASMKNSDYSTKQLGFTYRNSSIDTKNVITKTLTQLLHVGMYMRGWTGVGAYPIKEAPVNRDYEATVALNVTRSINDFEGLCRSLGRIGKDIINLPLVNYKVGQYQPSTEAKNGLTVGERISIVKGGDKSSNMSSCIRLSSNWLCSSAHKYIIGLGLEPPFDIFNLRHIS
jgi:hypothetical protein